MEDPIDKPESPQDLVRLFAEAWNRGDADAIGALFAQDADFVNVVGLWWRRRRDIAKAHGYAFDRYFKKARMTLERIEVRQIRHDVATVHGLWRMEGQVEPDGAPSPPRTGILLFVAKRTEDGWQVVAAQNTDIAPGAETQSAAGGTLTPVSYPA